MSKGPTGEKRPADVIGNAVKVMRIAVDEDDDAVPDDGKIKVAQASEKLGSMARAKTVSATRRSEIAKKAAAKLWTKV